MDPENISLKVGDQAKLNASVVPSNTNATLQWTSDNEAVATVDETGNVVAIAEGTANITVSTVDGLLTAKAVILVVQNPPIDEETKGRYTQWPAKFNVAVDHTFSVKFSIAFNIETILEKNLYITDSENQIVPISFIIENTDQSPSTVRLKPLNNYTKGETYTLWIKDILGKNGEVLKQNVKMDFTISK